jgi:hypothetical protein
MPFTRIFIGIVLDLKGAVNERIAVAKWHPSCHFAPQYGK